MKRATITYTKNNLSRLLGMVKEGETILVMDRRSPVARIEPVDREALQPDERLRTMVENGIVAAPRHALDVKRFLKAEMGESRNGASAVAALLREREESR